MLSIYSCYSCFPCSLSLKEKTKKKTNESFWRFFFFFWEIEKKKSAGFLRVGRVMANKQFFMPNYETTLHKWHSRGGAAMWQLSSELVLCWFQTNLPLCRYVRRVIIACCSRVTALSGHAALALSQSGIAPELNRIQLSAVCRCGQSGGVIDLLARCCLPLGLPSVASGACAVVQKSPSKRQCRERQASLKAALIKALFSNSGKWN